MTSRRLAACLLLLATLGPARASAAPPLVILPDAPPAPATLRRALGRTGPARSRAEAWRMLREGRARLRLARALRAAETGRQAVTTMRLEPARLALREALGHFAAAQPLPEACRGAHDAARDLSFLHWQRQELAVARRWRAAAAGLDVTGQAGAVDPTRYPPGFVAFWRARDDNPAAIPVTVTVKRQDAAGRAAPAAEAWINCKAAGKTPAAVSVAGAALVALASGANTASRLVEPDRSELIELPLAADDELSAEDAAALLQAAGAPALLWVRREASGGWVIDRFAPAGGWQRPYRRVAAPPARPAVEQGRVKERPAATVSTLPGWALTGAAAAALVAGAVTAALAGAAADEIERKAANEELFDPADERDNRRLSTASYTTLAVGGALAAGAAIFWIWRALRSDARPAAAGLTVRGAGLALRW